MIGGAVAATFGLRMVFIVTTALLLIGWIWTWYSVPKDVNDSLPLDFNADSDDCDENNTKCTTSPV